MKFSLKAIVEGVEQSSDEVHSYLDHQTGDVVLVMDELLTGLGDDAEGGPTEATVKADNSGRYVELPAQRDAREFDMMSAFAETVKEPVVSRSLLRALDGKGAFRRFKDAVAEEGLRDDWFKFRDDRYAKFVVDWCEDNEIEFVNDLDK